MELCFSLLKVLAAIKPSQEYRQYNNLLVPTVPKKSHFAEKNLKLSSRLAGIGTA